jgi:hypothetical protein
VVDLDLLLQEMVIPQHKTLEVVVVVLAVVLQPRFRLWVETVVLELL